MSIFQAILLGIVQGLTEFLPVSSSGHLVLMSQVLGAGDSDNLFFFTLLHLATLGAVVVFFFKDLLKLRWKEIALIGLATLPAVVVAFLFKDLIEGMFTSSLLVGFTLLITGGLNFVSHFQLKKQAKGESTGDKQEVSTDASNYGSTQVAQVVQEDSKMTPDRQFFPNFKQGFLIGVAQAVAITPGISRSGSTVAAALVQGVSEEAAFRFSFLLSIPAILGAVVLEGAELVGSSGGLSIGMSEAFGIVAAFITGLLSLKLFTLVLARQQMNWFGVYSVVVGLVVIALSVVS